MYKTAYYVSKTGNDANSGLSWAAAKLTIQAAIGDAANGDAILIGPGNFNESVDGSNKHLQFFGVGYGNGGTQITGSGSGGASNAVMKMGYGSLLEAIEVSASSSDPEGTCAILCSDDCTFKESRITAVNTGSGDAQAIQPGTNCRAYDSIIDGQPDTSMVFYRCKLLNIAGNPVAFESIVSGVPTGITPSAPADPAKCNCYGLTVGNDGNAQPNVEVELQLSEGPGTAGYLYARGSFTATSDVDGLLQVDLVKNSTYHVRRRGVGDWVSLVVGASGTQAINEVLGRLGGD